MATKLHAEASEVSPLPKERLNSPGPTSTTFYPEYLKTIPASSTPKPTCPPFAKPSPPPASDPGKRVCAPQTVPLIPTHPNIQPITKQKTINSAASNTVNTSATFADISTAN